MTPFTTEAQVGGDGRVVLDGLPFEAGERVEVTVVAIGADEARPPYPLRGLPVGYDDPFGSVAEEEWDATQT